MLNFKMNVFGMVSLYQNLCNNKNLQLILEKNEKILKFVDNCDIIYLEKVCINPRSTCFCRKVVERR